MSKEDKFETMPPEFVKLFNRYVDEVLHEPVDEIERKAKEIYDSLHAGNVCGPAFTCWTLD